MAQIYTCIKERSQIVSFSCLSEHSLAYATKYSGAKIIDVNNHSTKLKLVHSELNSETTAICFSQDAKFMAFANGGMIFVLDLETKQLIKNILISNEKVEILTFCSASTYLIAGTDCGRVYQYRYNNASILSRLCSFPYKNKRTKTNYVSAFAMHKEKLACSGQGGALFVIDLHSKIRKNVLVEEGSRIDALCFIDDNTLVSGNVDGDVLIHSLNNANEARFIGAPFKNIRNIVKSPNNDYAIASADTNYVSLLDIKKAKVAYVRYIEFEKNISKIAISNNASLFVALEDSQILSAKLPNRVQLKKLIMQNSLYEAYRLVENEPTLHNTIEYKLLEKRYKDIYKEALNALMNQNKTYALKCIEPLKGIRSKENEINSLFRAFENFNRFKVLYYEKKYALCFAMTSKFKALMQTPLYAKIEEAWRDSFKNAYRHIMLGDLQSAKVLLHEYLPVTSKRSIIKLLLNQESAFMAFLHAVESGDFQTIDELSHKNKLFLEAPTYITLSLSIEKNIKKIDLFIKQGDLQKAKDHLKLFKNTSFMKDELERLITNFNSMIKLKNAYKTDDFKACYEILDTNKDLNATELGIALNKRWAALINECEEYALQGDAKSIKVSLKNLIGITTRKEKIGDLLRVSFQSKIKTFLAEENYQGAQNIIYSYVDIFGNDNEMKFLMKNYEHSSRQKLAITLENGERTPRDAWLQSELIMEYAVKALK